MELLGCQIENIPFTGPKRIFKGEYFIKGPLPIWWIKIANQECIPTAQTIGLILFYRRGLNAVNRPITANELEMFGISRWSKRQALRELSDARLITLEKSGRRLNPILDLSTRKPTPPSLVTQTPTVPMTLPNTILLLNN